MMNTPMSTHFHNVKIPRSALSNLNKPARRVNPTPIIAIGDGQCLIPMIADGRLICLTADEIGALGGDTPPTGDILVGVEGRKFAVSTDVATHWTLVRRDGRWSFDAC